MEKTESTEPLLEKNESRKVRQVVGKVLVYERAIDKNLLMILNTIATQQEHVTARTANLTTDMASLTDPSAAINSSTPT